MFNLCPKDDSSKALRNILSFLEYFDSLDFQSRWTTLVIFIDWDPQFVLPNVQMNYQQPVKV